MSLQLLQHARWTPCTFINGPAFHIAAQEGTCFRFQSLACVLIWAETLGELLDEVGLGEMAVLVAGKEDDAADSRTMAPPRACGSVAVRFGGG